MLTAKQVQEILNVPDEEVFAHGLTLDRHTLDLYFKNGKVVRHTFKGGIGWGGYLEERFTESELFSWQELAGDHKGFYRTQTNAKFIDFVESFGDFNHLY